MGKKRLRSSFKNKLLTSYILLIMTPVIILGSFAYHSSVESSREQTRQNIRGTLRQMKDNVYFQLNDIERVAEQIYKDQMLQGYLVRKGAGWGSYDNLVNDIKPSLHRAVELTPLNLVMQIYLNNETIPEYYFDQDKESNPLNLPKRYEIFHLSRIEKQDWYIDWNAESEAEGAFAVKWQQMDKDREFGNLSLLRRLHYFSRNELLGFVKITVKLGDIFHSVNYSNIGEHAGVFIYNEAGETLFFSGEDKWSSRTGKNTEWLSDYLTIAEQFETTNWKVVAYIPNELLAKNAANVRNITIMVCLISFILLSVVSGFISRYFSRRMTKIVTSIDAFREGEFMKRISFKGNGNDEFVQIALAFNDMAKNINELISEVYLANLRKRDAELTSLQAQINPHFLYNTLSSISRLAKFGEVEKLHEMVMGLAKFYRLTLSDGESIISVDKEIQQVQSYVDIQKIKYEAGLDVFYEVSPDILCYKTVKLILQPFVENVLEHAWKGDHIYIHIVAFKEEENIIFNISDDGLGMAKETIEQVFNRDGPRIGYGIRNVDDRIKLQFGEQYGVHIESAPNEGTTVRIVVPCIL